MVLKKIISLKTINIMSCKIYPPVAGKFLPHEFGPYDNIDPNSIIQYKKCPNYIPSFPYIQNMGKIDIIKWLKSKNVVEKFNPNETNYTSLVIATIIIVIFILLING